MDIKFILDEIQKADPEVYEKLSPRRDILKSFGSKVAVAALPLAFGSMFKKAYGKVTDVIIDTLNFALTLEYLEFNFYNHFNNSTLAIAGGDKPAFATIEAHEMEHVNFLRTAIHASGGTPYTPKYYTGDPVTGSPINPASYDFTAAGTFADIATNYATFLAVAQTFEDTGVRAYKGQAGNLQTNLDVLTDALQIHSVEARHASHVRNIRRLAGAAANKPWITGNTAPAPPAQGSYNGEENTMQGTVSITSLSGVSGNISTNAATEAFDEPLTMAQVVTIVTPFFKP